MDDKAMDQWIRNMIRDEKEGLLFDALRMIKRIAGATPLDGDFGDEFDQARKGLRRLADRLLADLPEYQQRDPVVF